MHIWAAKTDDERREVIDKYYNFTASASRSQRDFNILEQSGEKAGTIKSSRILYKDKEKEIII